MSVAVALVLLNNAERAATVPIRTGARRTLPCAALMIASAMCCVTPDRVRVPAITNMHANMMMTSLANPENAIAGLIKPVVTSAISPSSAVTSIGSSSIVSKIMMLTSRNSMIMIWIVIIRRASLRLSGDHRHTELPSVRYKPELSKCSGVEIILNMATVSRFRTVMRTW